MSVAIGALVCVVGGSLVITTKVEAADSGHFTMNACTQFAKTFPAYISIATFNIGGVGTRGLSDVSQVHDIKRLLFEVNQVDIAAFQEVKIINRGNNSQNPYIEPEFIQFESQLADYSRVFRGHDNIKKNIPGWENRPKEGMNGGMWYGNMIITKFPLRASSYREYRFGSEKYPRYFISVIVETPQGPLRVYNIHTRGYPEAESAYGVRQVMVFLQKVSGAEPSMPFVVLGDFNHEYGKIAIHVANLASGLGVNMGCENSALCFLKGIDFVFTGNGAILRNRCKVESTPDNKFFGSDHDPVYATISLNTVIKKAGDLDGNGQIDTSDYALFLAQFGKTGSPGFHPADIDKNGRVDIFDYSKLLGAGASQ